MNHMDKRSQVTLFNALAWIDSLKTREETVNPEAIDAALIRLT